MAEFYDSENNDKIIRDEFFTNEDYTGVFIDIGAHDDKWLSISRHFYESNWTVISVEPNPVQYEKLLLERKNVFNYACSDQNIDNAPFGIYTLNGIGTAGLTGLEINNQPLSPFYPSHKDREMNKQTITVNVRTLDFIIDEYNSTNKNKIKKIDVLSIDVEGNEINVLKGLDFEKFDPTLIIVEAIDVDDMLCEVSMDEYMVQKGYEKIKRNVYNNYYIKKNGNNREFNR